ncbi:7033_t:CDS:2, partial [Cetraspora pellucida]
RSAPLCIQIYSKKSEFSPANYYPTDLRSKYKLEVSKILFGTASFGGFYDEVGKCTPYDAVLRALELVLIMETAKKFSDQFSHRSMINIQGHTIILLQKLEDMVQLKKTLITLRESVEESCRRLRTDYLDVVYAHDVEYVDTDKVVGNNGALMELFKLKKEGKIKYVGICGRKLQY